MSDISQSVDLIKGEIDQVAHDELDNMSQLRDRMSQLVNLINSEVDRLTLEEMRRRESPNYKKIREETLRELLEKLEIPIRTLMGE